MGTLGRDKVSSVSASDPAASFLPATMPPKYFTKAALKRGKYTRKEMSHDIFDDTAQGPPETPGGSIEMLISPSKMEIQPRQEEPEEDDDDSQEILEDSQQLDYSYTQKHLKLVVEEERQQKEAQDLSLGQSQEYQEPQQHQEEEPSTHSASDSTDTQKSQMFNKREEGALAEWLQENDFIYNRTHEDYKNKIKKERVITEKGRSLRPPRTLQEINRWIHTRRTQFGKLLKKMEGKSGAARRRETDHERWILQTFQFFKRHIQRQRPSRSLGMSQVGLLQNAYNFSIKMVKCY